MESLGDRACVQGYGRWVNTGVEMLLGSRDRCSGSVQCRHDLRSDVSRGTSGGMDGEADGPCNAR